LNIIIAFVWGALLFGELQGLSTARFAVPAARSSRCWPGCCA
jgi:hypothetical protein